MKVPYLERLDSGHVFIVKFARPDYRKLGKVNREGFLLAQDFGVPVQDENRKWTGFYELAKSARDIDIWSWYRNPSWHLQGPDAVAPDVSNLMEQQNETA